MLAYVFWHSRQRETERATYQDALIRFHRTLKSSPPAGYRGFRIFRLESAPWIPSEREVYEGRALGHRLISIGRKPSS